jgi:hypothetical protein
MITKTVEEKKIEREMRKATKTAIVMINDEDLTPGPESKELSSQEPNGMEGNASLPLALPPSSC